MKRSCFSMLGSAILGAAFCAPAAQAQEVCSNLVNGSYAVTGSGTAIGIGPIAFVAVFNFDGDGHLSGNFYQKVNGNNVQVSFIGTYSADASCVVSVTNYLASGATATLVLVFADGGKEFYLLNTTPPTATSGSVVSGVGKRRRKD